MAETLPQPCILAGAILAGIICLSFLVCLHFFRLTIFSIALWAVLVSLALGWGALSPSWDKPFGYTFEDVNVVSPQDDDDGMSFLGL